MPPLALPTPALLLDSVGIGEWLVLVVVVLLVYGPDRLPGIARKIGRVLAECRRAASLFLAQLGDLERDASETPETPLPDAAADASGTDDSQSPPREAPP